jgi:hypothetical protein
MPRIEPGIYYVLYYLKVRFTLEKAVHGNCRIVLDKFSCKKTHKIRR